MSQPEVPSGWEMPPLMTDQELAALLRKSELNNARNARRSANKRAARLAKIDAIPAAPLGPNGEWPIFGPMLNGAFTFTFVTPKYTSTEWEDDPWARESIKTPEEVKKEAIDKSLKYWPWRQTVPRKLVTLAPFLFSNIRGPTKLGQPFALPEVEQKCLLFEMLLSNELIRQSLTDLLFQNHDTAWKFAATSRQSWRYITFYTANWDFTRGWFGNCEFPRDRFLDSDNLIAEPIFGSVPSVVIVSPVRGPMVFPANIEDLEEVHEVVEKHLYEGQIWSLYKMCLAMSNFADYFRNLQLHRIPFLTTDVLTLIVPMMRNLKVLGVYQCQLIHVGDTLRLLEIIQVDKVQEKKNQISIDFYPNYHVGPISFPGNDYCTGSFGVTWDNWNGDSRIAVWQLVSIIIPQAMSQNQDFRSKHTMFRQWLDKTPCWRVAETLATLERAPGDTRTDVEVDEDFIVMVDYPNTGGSKAKFKSDLPNCPEGYTWKLERHPCHVCGLSPLGIFFYYDEIRQATNQGLTGAQLQLTCLACRLVSVLNHERDHYKSKKRGVIEYWLRDEEEDEDSEEQAWNDTNMPKALEDFVERKVVLQARQMDKRRFNEMMHPRRPDDALDRENDERQVPLNNYEKGRLGMKNRSPTVDSKDPVFNKWNAIDRSRTWAHGHGIPF